MLGMIKLHKLFQLSLIKITRKKYQNKMRNKIKFKFPYLVGRPVLPGVRQWNYELRPVQQGLDQRKNISHAQEAGQ